VSYDDEPDPRNPVRDTQRDRTCAGGACLLALFVLFSIAICVSGCRSNVAPLAARVLDRHDAYVAADTSLRPAQRRVYLGSSAILRVELEVGE